MKNAKMRCAMCKDGKLRRATLKLERQVAGHRFTATVKGHECPSCKEGFISGADVERFDLVTHALWRRRRSHPARP